MIDLNFPSAKIIAHSEAPNGEQLITMELEFHRFILSELNTHRSFSRNAQSSRAVPIEKMIEQVKTDPAMPVHWGKNQAGMVAEKELDATSKDEAVLYWISTAQTAASYATLMKDSGCHKQIVNRLLEPFMKTKGVVTATRTAYEAFFKLRCHKDSQPEIKLLAERMRDAIQSSVAVDKKYGEYHLPYLDTFELGGETFYGKNVGGGGLKTAFHYDKLIDAVKVSTSCCAQVSYRRLDDSLGKALKVYDMLNLPVDGVYPEDPPHFSPTEHIAKIVDAERMYDGGICDVNTISGNFNTNVFWQYRKALEIGMEQEFLE